MAKHPKDKMQEKRSKPSKKENSTLLDYALEKLNTPDRPVKKGKLPKNWSRVIFKR
ncbi:MAG: hypothetical protein PVJ41_16950 [Desulfobacterales bacterium]|jgi:hypothetical protein